jgi:hypothetical protein
MQGLRALGLPSMADRWGGRRIEAIGFGKKASCHKLLQRKKLQSFCKNCRCYLSGVKLDSRLFR